MIMTFFHKIVNFLNIIVIEMNIRDEVKILLMKRKMTLTALAKIMKEKTGKNYSQSLLSHKLADESLKYSEMKLICDILDFKIQYFDKKE